MGRPSRVKPLPAGTNRRGFFTKSGSAAMALASAPMLALAHDDERDDDDDVRSGGVTFEHGVASGDPLRHRVMLWTRVTRKGQPRGVLVRYVIALDPQLRHVVDRGALHTGPERDYTVKIDAGGLRPGTTYYYRFQSRGASSPIGRTRTLPAGATPRLRLAVVSCSNHAAS